MKGLYFSAFCLLVFQPIMCLSSSGRANEKIPDAAVWAGFQINQNLPGKWLAGVEYQSRFTRNMSFHRGHFSFLSLTWKPLDYFTATAEYRQVNAFDGNTHRLGIELTLKRKWQNLSFYKRTVFQSEIYGVNPHDQRPEFPSDFWRERLMIRYDFMPAFRLLASAEFFFRLPNPLTFQRFRSQVGGSYELNKRVTLTALWLYQEEFGIRNPDITHAWVISTSVDLPNWWKKKKRQKKESSALPE